MSDKYRKLLIISLGIILISCVLATNPKFEFRLFALKLPDRKIKLNEKDLSINSKKSYMSFNYDKDGNIILNYDRLLADKMGNISYMDLVSKNESFNATSEKITNKMSGRFFASADVNTIDVNEDGKNDNVHVYAKTDTLDVQGFNPNGFIPQNPSENLPFEIIYRKGNALELYSYGKAVNGKISIASKLGLKEDITIKDGIIPFIDLRDLRAGVEITYLDGKGKHYIANYVQEKHTLLTKSHAKAMVAFVILVILSIIGIVLLAIYLKIQRERKLKELLATK